MVSHRRFIDLFFRPLLVILSLSLSHCIDEGALDSSPFPYGGAIMGYSLQNRPIVVERFGNEGPVAFLFHAIHGDETPAEQLGERMRNWLLVNPDAWEDIQVLFITQVNPDGYAMHTRRNANDIDLNRNFPASNFEPTETFGPSPASEPETQVIVSLMQESDPTAVVSVHSPLDAINYDGPAEALAELMAQESGMVIDQGIGFYPGSFGSYSGIDLQIPTVTLELPDAISDLQGYQPGLAVERVALQYVRDNGKPGPALGEIVADSDPDDEYQNWVLGISSGGRPIVAEQFGTSGSAVLVVAALDGDAQTVLVAERLRARIFGLLGEETTQQRFLLITLANPDGVAANAPLNHDGLDPDRSFSKGFKAGEAAGEEPFESPESKLLRDFVHEQDVNAAVVILGRSDVFTLGIDGAAEHMAEAVQETTDATLEHSNSGRPGSLAAWAASESIPALTLFVPTEPRDSAVYRTNDISAAILSAVDVDNEAKE